MRWSYAHNQLGYTTNPTVAVDYISTDPLTWGEEISGSHGYYDGDVYEPQDGLYFTNDVSPEYRGWKTADILARLGRMPSECIIDDDVKFTNGSVQSKCALLKIDEQYEHEDYYLIAAAVNLGWHTISEWDNLGWHIFVPEDILFGGDFNGNDIKAKDVGGGGGNVRKYASYKALEELQGWSPGGSFTQYEIIGDIITATSDSSIIISSDDFGGIVR